MLGLDCYNSEQNCNNADSNKFRTLSKFWDDKSNDRSDNEYTSARSDKESGSSDSGSSDNEEYSDDNLEHKNEQLKRKAQGSSPEQLEFQLSRREKKKLKKSLVKQ